jgi:small GTP-binding protein
MIIIGPLGVGKSSLLNKFTRGEFKEGYNPTLGVEFYSKSIEVDSDTPIKLQIWDTAGQ